MKTWSCRSRERVRNSPSQAAASGLVLQSRPTGGAPQPIMSGCFHPQKGSKTMDIEPIATGGIGQPVQRKEDRRLVTGAGRYTSDVFLPGQLYAAIVRSPHAHARIKKIDSARAKAAP